MADNLPAPHDGHRPGDQEPPRDHQHQRDHGADHRHDSGGPHGPHYSGSEMSEHQARVAQSMLPGLLIRGCITQQQFNSFSRHYKSIIDDHHRRRTAGAAAGGAVPDEAIEAMILKDPSMLNHFAPLMTREQYDGIVKKLNGKKENK